MFTLTVHLGLGNAKLVCFLLGYQDGLMGLVGQVGFESI